MNRISDDERDARMDVAQTEQWLDQQIQKARDYRTEKGKPPMTALEESLLRDRLRQAIAR